MKTFIKLPCIVLVFLLSSPIQSQVLWLDSLDLSTVEMFGNAKACKTVWGGDMIIRGKLYKRGVGTHAGSNFDIDLKGSAQSFHAILGVDDDANTAMATSSIKGGTVVFKISVDGKLKYNSGLVTSHDEAKTVDIDLNGASQLSLTAETYTDGDAYDHADWADAQIVLKPGAKEMPRPLNLIERPKEYILTPKTSEMPAINGPEVIGARPGHPFLFRIPATGKQPKTFVAKNLPNGLELNTNTGIITGVVPQKGSYPIQIEVSNNLGKTTKVLNIVAGDNLALTPPMGWSAWNCFAEKTSDSLVRATADAMVAQGLADVGFTYINIDEGWQAGRDSLGFIMTNSKFPDMKDLTDYVHSKGLKIGIYSSPGPKTCGDFMGSFGHEKQDIETISKWGFDYFKYDWCSCTDSSFTRPYAYMNQFIEATDRDIVYSICEYGLGEVWKWGSSAGGQLWRTGGDIVDTWASVAHIIEMQDGLEKYAGPGNWNDPDMLVVGNVGWGKLRPTRLSANDQYTQITFWSILASPLILGCDLCSLDSFTLNLLTNSEVIAINQDKAGKQGHRIKNSDNTQVWVKELSDGSKAIALYNRSPKDKEVSVKLSEIGMKAPVSIRDVWRQKELLKSNESISAIVAPHGVALYKVSNLQKKGE